MKQKISRREFLETVAKAAAGIGIGTAGIEALLPKEAFALNRHPKTKIGHTANGYTLTLEGYFTSQQMIELDETYKLLEHFLEKPTVVNNEFIFDEASTKINGDYNGGASTVIRGPIKTAYGDLIEFMPQISLKIPGKISKTLLHEFGHCWFAYMEHFVTGGKEWVDRFNKEIPVEKLKKRNYSKEERQSEIQADSFRDHISTKKYIKLFSEGFKLYNKYVNAVRKCSDKGPDFTCNYSKGETDLRLKIINPADTK